MRSWDVLEEIVNILTTAYDLLEQSVIIGLPWGISFWIGHLFMLLWILESTFNCRGLCSVCDLKYTFAWLEYDDCGEGLVEFHYLLQYFGKLAHIISCSVLGYTIWDWLLIHDFPCLQQWLHLLHRLVWKLILYFVRCCQFYIPIILLARGDYQIKWWSLISLRVIK